MPKSAEVGRIKSVCSSLVRASAKPCKSVLSAPSKALATFRFWPLTSSREGRKPPLTSGEQRRRNDVSKRSGGRSLTLLNSKLRGCAAGAAVFVFSDLGLRKLEL